MNGHRLLARFDFRPRGPRSVGAVLLCLVVSAWSATPAEAARMRPRGLTARSTAPRQQAWARFLAGGPDRWATTPSPPIPSGARLPLVNGGLLQTPFVDYLLWRRALNPARFDANHPVVARVFEQLVPLPEVQSPITVPPVVVPDPIDPVNPVAQEIVPEPGTLAIALTLIGAGLAFRLRGRP